MSTLSELAVKYASDKFYKHSYIDVYERLFEGFSPKRVLEIGIGYPELMQRQLPSGVGYVHGSSLRMWSELWPDAAIYGADIRLDTHINEGRIRSLYVDQSSFDTMKTLGEYFGPFDLIIDDGSHYLGDQFKSALALLPALSCGGIYVIEDLLPDNADFLVRLLQQGEVIRLGKTWDDNLVIVRGN